MRTPHTFCCALALLLALGSAVQAQPAIRIAGKDGKAVEVTGLSEESLGKLAGLADDAEKWSEVFTVRVDRGGKPTLAMLGTYQIANGVLRFTPRFPLAPGVRYRASVKPSAGGKPVEVVLSIPKKASTPTAVVTQVYPTADRLPENQLKFYVHFSAPMSQGGSYRHLQLLDAKGKAVDLPFLELDEELWDPSGKRFTVFLDPGRIKRGLKPREEAGPVLEEGKRYTLVVSAGWLDAEGNPLKEGFRKSFSVGAPDDAQPDVKTWKVKAPASGSRGVLRVTFPEPMEHALLHRLVEVAGPDGKPLPGEVAVTGRETVWSFTPAKAWKPGTYHLIADNQLEDLAGNSLGRPFEIDVLRPVERRIKVEKVKLAFEVK